jgi:esterase
MSMPAHRTGTVRSGGVTLFYRHFGKGGAGAPVVIFHGANYYDSADWIAVASALADEREVVAFDLRGFGESSWSVSKDYSLDALMGDAVTLLDHLGWQRAAIMGHSLGGSYAIVFGARFPLRTAAVILVDHCPGEGGGGRAQPATTAPAKAFPTLDAALAATSRDPRTPRARVEAFCKPVEGGFQFRRDPAFSNRTPTIPGWTAKIVVADPWAELASIRAPILIVRGTQSDRFTPERLARVAKDVPKARIVDAPCGHDVAAGAPDILTAAVRDFLREPVPAAH